MGRASAPATTRHAAPRAPPGPHQRRARVGQRAVRMAVRALADAGDGPALRRHRLRPPPLPRPAGPRARPRPCQAQRPLRSGDAGAQQAACRGSRRTRLGSGRWKRGWRSMAPAIAEARAVDSRGAGGTARPPRPKAPFARAMIALEGDEPTTCRALAASRAPRCRRRPHARRTASRRSGRHPSRPRTARRALLDRRAEGAADRPDPRPCRSRRRAHRRRPILLLDEIAAHLDPCRRAALFERLAAAGGQVWMTGTEPSLFSALGTGRLPARSRRRCRHAGLACAKPLALNAACRRASARVHARAAIERRAGWGVTRRSVCVRLYGFARPAPPLW